ncbi:hypothetical protein [Azospirillum picis]|uniref:Uncharacterized protein n=1 Tax=Azospirillum picis TaxID=488438 RepID=A0ABU0MRU4_9PROT|nr:hypothetical protein [Azospirillum picis]MBP2302555.1 hypothetical protein [Azospirillum picis]MDQ0536203.1 hypothetical protein [Azospirillum picis]
MTRYTHPNPLRSDKEARQHHGAQDLSALVAQALAAGEATVKPVTAQDLRDSAERNAAALSKKRRAAARRGAEVRAAQKREAARRKEAAKS